MTSTGRATRCGSSTPPASPGSSRTWLADTYNNKVKRLDVRDGTVTTIAGSGAMGRADGTLGEATFFGPEGIAAGDGFLLVADTNNHALRRVDAASAQVDTIEIP